MQKIIFLEVLFFLNFSFLFAQKNKIPLDHHVYESWNKIEKKTIKMVIT